MSLSIISVQDQALTDRPFEYDGVSAKFISPQPQLFYISVSALYFTLESHCAYQGCQIDGCFSLSD